MADRSFLFIHSPLVGPSSLRRMAHTAATVGSDVLLPDLTSIASAASPHDEYVRRAVAGVGSSALPLIVVGHSGAGVFLPSIGHALARQTVLIFVDAVMPPLVGAHAATDDMKGLLNEQADDDGRLGKWLDWWPAEVVADLLPDERDRDLLVADMPRLHRSFYDTEVDVPDDWSEGRCAYLRLSHAYNAEHDEAAARQWPVATLESTHLGMHTHPEDVLAAVLALVEQLA